ncbi:dehydrogenase [Shinella sumterensis]|uniref:Dehydrogenase n=1 Tax=Shinella sumterensis TaxID=1967501 RepID=A0AA50CMI7_9HYPH|nr:dehydrogenase [Shinella sumterensis]WLR98765.1 dehydrogenase [Shinella sumterensis]
MRPIETRPGTIDAIDEALAWHNGDARAAIATLIADCAYLRWQLDLAGRAMSAGFTRGWQPSGERPDGV